MGCASCPERELLKDRPMPQRERITIRGSMLVMAVNVTEDQVVGKASGHKYPPVKNGDLMTMRKDDYELDDRFVKFSSDIARAVK